MTNYRSVIMVLVATCQRCMVGRKLKNTQFVEGKLGKGQKNFLFYFLS